MGSARSMTGGDLSLVKYMQDKQDKSDIHPRAPPIHTSDTVHRSGFDTYYLNSSYVKMS